MPDVQHIVTGLDAPAAAPPSVGAHYINTSTGEHYIATSTASAAGWVKQARGRLVHDDSQSTLSIDGSMSEVLWVVEAEHTSALVSLGQSLSGADVRLIIQPYFANVLDPAGFQVEFQATTGQGLYFGGSQQSSFSQVLDIGRVYEYRLRRTGSGRWWVERLDWPDMDAPQA